MSKRKWRRGPHILSLDELARQEIICWWDKPTARGWFLSWQFRMAANAVGENGATFYAMPSNARTRFSDVDVIHAERRLHTEPTLEGRKSLIHLLNEYDRGAGDVDDVIDWYESNESKFTLYIEEQPQEWGLTEDEVVEEIQKTEGVNEGDIRAAVREAAGLIERCGWSIASVEHPLFKHGYAIEVGEAVGR